MVATFLPGMLVVFLFTYGGYVCWKLNRRSALDVFDSLSEPLALPDKRLREDFPSSDEGKEHRKRGARGGTLSVEERRALRVKKRVIPIASALAFALLSILWKGTLALSGVVPAVVLGGALGVLYRERMSKKRIEKYHQELEFFLPIVMERLVMAVGAGLDLLSALQVVHDFDVSDPAEAEEEVRKPKIDPVTQLLASVLKLTESGLRFEDALEEVSMQVECSALRHAFIHLAVAYSEGGELVMPLRELSDSTQLYYQESIEEEIAKMPVKVTLPLLCTFAGLIIFFLTTPLVQVLEMTSRALPK